MRLLTLIIIAFAFSPQALCAREKSRVELKLPDGSTFSALLSTPINHKFPLPLMIILGGFKTGEKVIDLLPENLNFIYATIDYPYKSPNQRNFVSDLKEISKIRAAVHQMDLLINALIKVAVKDPRVDQDKISIVGASFGAPFAITAAVGNPEIDSILLINAFGRADRAIAKQLSNKWGSWSSPLALILGFAAWRYLNYSAPEVEARKLHQHQKVLYVYSEADEQVPQISIDSLKEGLALSKATITLATNEGGHIKSDKVKILNHVIDISLEWLRSK